GTVSVTFADGNTLSGKLFEDVSRTAMGVGPFTQIFTFTGGTGEFAGATGSFSGSTVGTTTGFTTSGSGTINAPAIPEPASAALLLGGLAVILVARRQSKVKISNELRC
ncbi:MAG: PEP-CTERM sorting domain-containing protein, partial [Bryobacteraceae bacterium]